MNVVVQAFRNLGRHGRRTAFNLAVIAAGAAALLLTLGFMRHSFRGLSEAIVAGGLAHLSVEPASSDAAAQVLPGPPQLTAWQPMLERIRAVPGVREASPVLRMTGLATSGDRSLPFLAEASDPARDREMGQVQRLIEGSWLPDAAPEPGEDAVVLGATLAAALGVHPGDTLTLLALNAEGTLDAMDVRIAGTTTSGLQELDARFVRMHVATAQALLGLSNVSSILVVLQDGTDAGVARGRDELRRILGDGAAPLEVRTWQERAPFYGQVRGLYAGIFAFLGAIILVVTSLANTSSLMMSMMERTREIGTLRAMGAGRGVVGALVVLEAAWLGVIGAALGALVSAGVALAVNASGLTLPPPPGAASRVDLRLEASAADHGLVAAVIVVALVLASLAPLWHVMRLRIAAALAHSLTATLAALLLAVAASAAPPAEAPEELLRAADVATLAPPSFRARFHVVMRDAERDVELWRDGPDRSLVRVLGEGEAGKYTLRIGTGAWLITPRAKHPVKLGAALKLRGGAALDVLTAASYSRDYGIASAAPQVEEGRNVVVFELRRRKTAGAGLASRVKYVVDVAQRHPVRIETYSASGRPAATLTLSGWPATPGLPKLAHLVDHLQSGASTDVTLLELESRAIPAALFDLADPSTRRALLESPSP